MSGAWEVPIQNTYTCKQTCGVAHNIASGTIDRAVVFGSTLDLQGVRVKLNVKILLRFHKIKMLVKNTNIRTWAQTESYTHIVKTSAHFRATKISPKWMLGHLPYGILRRTTWYSVEWGIKFTRSVGQFVPCNMTDPFLRHSFFVIFILFVTIRPT
jgi:hypothetical protein